MPFRRNHFSHRNSERSSLCLSQINGIKYSRVIGSRFVQIHRMSHERETSEIPTPVYLATLFCVSILAIDPSTDDPSTTVNGTEPSRDEASHGRRLGNGKHLRIVVSLDENREALARSPLCSRDSAIPGR